MGNKNLERKFREYDNFGYKIELNFNEKGGSVNSTLGAIISVLIKGLLFAYIMIKLGRMRSKNYN